MAVLVETTVKTVALSDIVFDAGTQVREAINEQVVGDYAERLTEGVQFPAVVLFHDGNRYYMADGFHRGMAHIRVGREEIAADVRPGTREDALWFALGANKANGSRMTAVDKKHAIVLAVQTWKDTKTQTAIAEQIGCSQGLVSQVISANNLLGDRPQRVIGKDGKSYPSSRAAVDARRSEIAAMARAGSSSAEIVSALGTHATLVADVRREIGLGMPDRSQAAVAERRDRMRQMASSGYTSRQMAAELGIAEETCRHVIRQEQIDVPADRATKHSHRHDSNRIVEHIVMDAENLTADVNLIDFDSLDREQIGAWIDSLVSARKALNTFINRLIKEKQQHGEAA